MREGVTGQEYTYTRAEHKGEKGTGRDENGEEKEHIKRRGHTKRKKDQNKATPRQEEGARHAQKKSC